MTGSLRPAVDAVQLLRCAHHHNAAGRNAILREYSHHHEPDACRCALDLAAHLAVFVHELAQRHTDATPWIEHRLADAIPGVHEDSMLIVLDGTFAGNWPNVYAITARYVGTDDQTNPLVHLILELAQHGNSALRRGHLTDITGWLDTLYLDAINDDTVFTMRLD